MRIFTLLFFVFMTCLSAAASATEKWSPVLSIRLIFPQAKREDPNHPHSEKIFVALSDMSWLPAACTERNYFYIEKTDTQVYSLLMAAMFAKATVQIAVTDKELAAGVCRATMLGSPSWN